MHWDSEHLLCENKRVTLFLAEPQQGTLMEKRVILSGTEFWLNHDGEAQGLGIYMGCRLLARSWD